MASICAPMLKKLSPLHPFTFVYQTNSTFIVSRTVDPHLVAILFTSSSYATYKPLPFIKNNILRMHHFLLFIMHFFMGLWELDKCVNPGRFFKFSFYAFTCLSNNLLISSWISAKLVSALLPCMPYLPHYFKPEEKT